MNAKTRKVLMSSGKDDWGTPDSIFNPLNDEFAFDVDAAATQHNRKLEAWFGPGSLSTPDALTISWADHAGSVWCNPPYSRGLQKRFVMKGAAERLMGVQSVFLIPARTDLLPVEGAAHDLKRAAGLAVEMVTRLRALLSTA